MKAICIKQYENPFIEGLILFIPLNVYECKEGLNGEIIMTTCAHKLNGSYASEWACSTKKYHRDDTKTYPEFDEHFVIIDDQ
jgi:hypothetical protein